MSFIDFTLLDKRKDAIRADFNSKRPFRFTVFENFFSPEAASQIANEYPTIQNGIWDGTTYIEQKNKFQKNKFEEGTLFQKVFSELNSNAFLKWLSEVTLIPDLIGDDELFGGGLHQSIRGAFLNVHVDYNIHPKTKLHRRLNVLVYMNKDWKDEFEGHLELWDLSSNKKILLSQYAPNFNRCVIFETNEISFHGHPKPLKAPEGINRKSIAVYYYTATRPGAEMTAEHNTIYVNTEGIKGNLKRLSSGLKAFLERTKR